MKKRKLNWRKVVNLVLSIITVGMLWVACVMVIRYSIITNRTENLYPLFTTVVQTDFATDTVTVKDFNHNLWQFKGVEDWTVKDICACLMDSHGTPEIKDDKIVSVRYCGWVE